MKHFCTFVSALLLASSAIAATPADNLTFRQGGKIMPITHKKGNLKKGKSIAKITDADLTGDIITEAPVGETKHYSGSSMSYYHIFSLEEEEVKGAIYDITYTEDGKAYWLNPLSQAPCGSYIVGDVEGDKITFNFPQHLYDDFTYE